MENKVYPCTSQFLILHVYESGALDGLNYREIPKCLDAKKPCCNLSKLQTKRPNLRVFFQNDANGLANSEDPDRTAPLGAV